MTSTILNAPKMIPKMEYPKNKTSLEAKLLAKERIRTNVFMLSGKNQKSYDRLAIFSLKATEVMEVFEL